MSLASVAFHMSRILLIEDEPDVRAVHRRLLEKAGHEVIESTDGAEALAQLRSGPTPSVILLDLMMPKLDGWGFMEMVRAVPTFREIPIVVVSAYGSAESVRAAGATDYLKKPVDPKQMLDVVQRCAKRSP